MRGCRTPVRQMRQEKELRGATDEYDMRWTHGPSGTGMGLTDEYDMRWTHGSSGTGMGLLLASSGAVTTAFDRRFGGACVRCVFGVGCSKSLAHVLFEADGVSWILCAVFRVLQVGLIKWQKKQKKMVQRLFEIPARAASENMRSPFTPTCVHSTRHKARFPQPQSPGR